MAQQGQGLNFTSGQTNPYAALGSAFGGQFLQGIGSLIGGPSRSQKLSRQVFGDAQSQLGQEVFNPRAFIQNIMLAQRPQLEQQAQKFQKFGIQGPLAKAGLAQLQSSDFAKIFNQLQLQATQLKTQRDLALRNIMLGSAQSA